MEWAEMDIGALLGDLEDEEDHTDQHWKRSANDQPTATSAGHQDNHNKQYQATEPRRPGTTLSSRLQGEEIQSGEEFHPDSPSYEPPQPERQSFTFGPQQPSYQRGGPPGRPAIPAGHAREDRPTERRSWARGPENQRNDVRQGWGRSSDKRSHDNRPYRPRDTDCRAEAKRHHSHQHTHQHTHYEPRRNWHQSRSRSSPTRDYSQEHEHNKHMGTTSDAARGRKRSRERTDHFTRSSHARPAHHHHQGSGRDKRRRREGESEQGSSARAERQPHDHAPGEPCDVPEAGHLQDEEKRRAEDNDRTRLDQEQQEWARIRAMTDKHLSNGEQPSPACNMEKRTTDERLNLAWHRLPTPFVFELAEVPYTVLASASGAEMSTLVEKNLKRKRVHLQRAIERQGNDGSSTAVESSCGSQVDQLQVINALLDWCCGELFPFLAEVDRWPTLPMPWAGRLAGRNSQVASRHRSQFASRYAQCARRHSAASCRVCVG
ncbi:uncharacterized protein ACA1_136780 [Acanthamoeba castellanii str. Neff]|uniref:Uncharacterized protein n=1 Tax=Acanthamoeba castellanii (strain ATCC 30010 / Neff) TaxID=1257118 RepID=L8GZG9_ACACF|nr:uncharacterized protein ACA1_136780 [Acanthamoeba castellanii str. Neff]ELR18367.1 hypothetical protein ACA1_136780 [Acanthamoeba castellanii str. Neff]